MAETRMQREGRPDPDPTTLTTQQLVRELAAQKDLFNAELRARDAFISAASDIVERVEKSAELSVKNLQELNNEKFASISRQFLDGKVALDAALSAAKTATDKTETNFASLINGQAGLIRTMTDATNEKINDVRDRVQAMESRSKGMGEGWGAIISTAAVVISLGTLIIMVLRH